MVLKRKGEPFLYGDHAYFTRGYENANFRYIYNGIHRTNMLDVDASRRKLFKAITQPWRTGEKILVIPAPRNPRTFHEEPDWNEQVIERLVHLTDRKIEVKKDKTKGLGNSIHNCWAVVSHSSVAGVEAAVAGVRVVGPKTSPSCQVGVDIDQIESPIEPDREQWINTLCHSQFHLTEIANGTAWQIIKETERL